MNEDATIKIFSKIQALERELQLTYHEYFNNCYTEEHFLAIESSIQKDLQTHYYIYNLILKDARQN
jgi:hypothetical protein